MNSMQMNGMQPGQPGGAMMMQQQQQQQQQQPQAPNGVLGRQMDQAADNGSTAADQHKTRLNTAIYDYFMKFGHFELARTLKNSSLPVKLETGSKRKADDDDKDDPNRPVDLPPAGLPASALSADSAFLLDWFSIFFDLLEKNGTKNPAAAQYMNHTQNFNRLQQQQQQNLMRQSAGGGGGMPSNSQIMMRNNMMNMRNGQGMMNPQQQQAFLARGRQMMQNASMARDGSAMDVDGNRPHTPSSGENAPSPNKRPRIDAAPFGPGMMNGMPGQMDANGMMNQQRASNLLMANGINPSGMTPQQMQTFGAQNAQVQNKSIQLYKQNMAVAHTMQRANMGGQGSPNMMNPGMDMQAMQGGNGDFYNGNNMNRAGVNGQNGHALQDYQQQLMLLERQNRKRLEMAKQEQEVGGFQGQNGMMQFAPNMSPSGSRQGPSPNPSEQMKRGTPQIPKGQIPGSPMPDGGPRASPSAINYNQMGPGMENGMRANGMQPPSSHPSFQNGGPGGMNHAQMQAMRVAQGGGGGGGGGGGSGGGPMPGAQAFQPGQQAPMAPGAQQPGANGQMGTPRQATAAMPPPQAVPPNQNATGRAPSPAPSAAASTPQTTNKPNPKKKESKKDRKPSTKKSNAAAAAAAAAASAETTETAPVTSTPATPITPAPNTVAFEKNKAAGAPQPNGAPAVNATQASQPAAPTDTMVADPSHNMGMDTFGTDLDFANLEAGDVLDQFNFDAFIEDGNGNLDNFNFDMGGFDDSGMQAGIGGEA